MDRTPSWTPSCKAQGNLIQPDAYRVFHGARLSPCVRRPERPHRLITLFGRHQANGKAIRGWPLLHSIDTTIALPARRAVADRPDHRIERAIYGGLYYGAFGHFLTETFPNLLAVAALKRQHPDVPLIFHTPDFFAPERPARVGKTERAHIQAFEDLGNVTAAGAILVDRPTEIGELLVPDAPFSRKFRYKPWVPAAIDRLFEGAPAPARPLYFSRTKWPRPRISNEVEVERLFAEAGYDIVHLQELRLAEQMAAVRSASDIAGPQGTALHWSLYAPDCNSVMSLGWGSPLQGGISKVRGQRYFELAGRPDKAVGHRVRKVRPQKVLRAIAGRISTA